MKNTEPGELPKVSITSKISPLTDLEISLIQNVHLGYAEIILEKEFHGGFSGTRVFLVLPVRSNGASDARVVTKIGPANELRHESGNYQNYAGPALPFTAAQVRDFYEQDGRAGLNYVFVGDADLGKSLSLEEYYRTHTAREVIETLENLLRKVLGPAWYGQAPPLTCLFRDEYGRHLPAHQELEIIVHTIFPKAASSDGSRLTIPGVSGTYPHPLVVYPELLDKSLKGRKSFVHGDLHLRNILVDETGKSWLIDFAKVTERHNLFDFIKLETYIRLMALAAEQGAFAWNDYAQLEEALAGNVAPPVNPALAKAYAIIQGVRKIVRNYMRDQNNIKGEYLAGLFLYCLATMKYYRSNGPAPTQLMFITICVLAKNLLEDDMSEKRQNINVSEKAGHQLPDEDVHPETPNDNGEKTNKDGGTIRVGDISHSTGIAIGHGARTNVTQTSNSTVDEIARAFATIMAEVNRERDSAKKEKAQKLVRKLEVEARKGEQADEDNVEDWFTILAKTSADAWEVAIATLANPIAGIGTAFQKIAQRAKEERGKR